MDRLAWVLTECTQNRLEAWKFRSSMGSVEVPTRPRTRDRLDQCEAPVFTGRWPELWHEADMLEHAREATF